VSEFHGDSAFRHEALQQLIRVLEKVREDDRPFDMSSWYDDENSQDIKLLTMPAEDCGTASCAAGWAARDPWFIERGFKLVELNEDDETLIVHYGESYGYDACMDFFKLPIETTTYLFGGQNPDDIESTIRRIEHVLAA